MQTSFLPTIDIRKVIYLYTSFGMREMGQKFSRKQKTLSKSEEFTVFTENEKYEKYSTSKSCFLFQIPFFHFILNFSGLANFEHDAAAASLGHQGGHIHNFEEVLEASRRGHCKKMGGSYGCL
jgi:hypothetical protein